MRLFKTILSIACVTILSLLYVHQQVELVKLSYAIEQNEKTLKDMLDHNESLGYNIDNLEAPSRLEKALQAEKIDVAFPKRDHVVKIAKLSVATAGKEAVLRSVGEEKNINLLRIFELFSPAREAQAKEK